MQYTPLKQWYYFTRYQCHIQGDSRLNIYDRSQASAFRITYNRSTSIEVCMKCRHTYKNKDKGS